MPATYPSLTQANAEHLAMIKAAWDATKDWETFGAYHQNKNTWHLINTKTGETHMENDLEYKKYKAQCRLERKFRQWESKREWRLSGAPRSTIMDRTEERKFVGQDIASLLNMHKKDDLKAFAAVWNFSNKTCHSFSWFSNVVKKRFGEDALGHWEFKSSWARPVWQDEVWFRESALARFHMVHQSEDNPQQIAYVRNLDNAKRELYTRTKPGKYLTQFFGDVLSQDEIREWAEKQIAYASCTGELKFVENDDGDAWVQVYEDGPQSCMKGSEAVRVYCYPDNKLRLAYIEDSNGYIVARSIVRNHADGSPWGYIRTYGTEHRWHTKLLEDLEALGYDTQVNMNGVKLTRIECDHDYGSGVMCPYIDTGDGGTQYLIIKDDHLLIDSDGDVCASNTSGSVPLEDDTCECERCGDRVDEDDTTYVESIGERVCESCLDSDFTYAMGRRYQDYFHNDDVIHCESDAEWYEEAHAALHDVYQCRATDNWYHIDDLVMCDFGQYEGSFINRDEAEQDHRSDEWGYRGDLTKLNGWWVNDEFLVDCHITGETFDVRDGVTIDMGLFRTKWGGYNRNRVYVSPGAWTLDLLREHFVECGGMLFPNTYMGNPLHEPFYPRNTENGTECDLIDLYDLLDDAIEYAEAA